jgi:mono/diheme cytochrome c family protein
VIAYPHSRDSGGDAIAGGFVYRGKLVPALRNKLVFGDITTGRIWYANRAEVIAADDGNAATLAPIHEMEADLRRLTEEKFRDRGGQGQTLPGSGAVSGRGRVDLRFAMDNQGELYILTKSDGMIRKVIGAKATAAPRTAPESTASAQMPTAIAAGKRVYDGNCAPCHGNLAQGAVKAGTPISIIEEQHGKQPPDLTDDQWDHGSTDDEIFGVIKRGLPPSMMAGYDGRLSDQDIRNVITYIRSLHTQK